MIMGELLEKGEIAQARRLSVLFGRKTHDLELILVSGISFCILFSFKMSSCVLFFVSLISPLEDFHKFMA